MMKNKHLVLVAIAGLFAWAVVGCKPQIDVEETCKDIAHTTLLGTDSVQAGVIVEGNSVRVIEYRFLPEQKATRTEMLFGDCVYEPAQTINLSYALADYADAKAGLHLLFTPEDANRAPYETLFFEGTLTEGDYVLPTKLGRIAYLQSVIAALPNTAWECHDTAKLIIDVTYMDTVINKTVTPGGVVRDTVITEKTKKDTLGIASTLDIRFALNRDANTLANTGEWDYKYFENKINADSTGVVPNDTAIMEKTFQIKSWNITSVTTDQRFVVNALTDSQEEPAITMSFAKCQPAKGTTDMTYSNLVKEETVNTKASFVLVP